MAEQVSLREPCLENVYTNKELAAQENEAFNPEKKVIDQLEDAGRPYGASYCQR